MRAVEQVAALTAVAALVKDALDTAKAEAMTEIREGDRSVAAVGDDELADVTFVRGSVKVEVASLRDLLDWCRENVPDAVVVKRELNARGRARALAAYVPEADDVDTRESVDPTLLAAFLKDAKAGEVFPGIVRTKGEGYLKVKQSPEQRSLVARLVREGAFPLELEGPRA